MTAVRVGTQPLDPARLVAAVASVATGATVLFLGTVRDHAHGKSVDGLEYTAYEAMAADELQRVVAEAIERFPGTRLAVEHRLGDLRPGDVSVAVAAAHAHRAAAFDAARYVIEELKARVPIWKREQFAGGERKWVRA
ncbi:MAG: molybdenum cofactor biosynthesis protein MoaE [Gemmatimonadaceae bacterium]|nr:molybdenum cofactor biosynthesis protein MoaE [Gemmatimonadaceae bacterium]